MRIPALFIATMIASACSIKEDRSVCPAEVGIAVSAPSSVLGRKIVLRAWEEGAVMQDSFLYGGGWQQRVYRLPRKALSLCSVSGVMERGTRYRIARGKQCDSIYSVSRSLHPSGENETDSLRLRKQFATVFLSVSGSSGEGPFPYRIRAVGNTDGLDLLSSEPSFGPFVFEPELSPGLSASFRLPRQADDGFALEFLDAVDGRLLFREESGRKLVRNGYDWSAVFLPDIEIRLVLTSSGIDINVGTWDACDPFEVEI